MTNTNYSIKIKDLKKVFYKKLTDHARSEINSESIPQKIALDNLSFTANAGERIGIIGHNGAGKSTLLSIIADIIKPTSGEVEINGKVTAILTLGVALREDLTGRENIFIDGQVQGKTDLEIESFVEEIIEFSELRASIDMPVRTYSTGMKSKLAFSMLTSLSPEILIIDEALSAGDVFFSRKAQERIHQICNKGKIVLIVSHSMQTINEMCNRVIWIDNGRIIMDGQSNTVTQAYLDKVRQDNSAVLLKKFYTLSNLYCKNDECKITNVKTMRGTLEANLFVNGDSFALQFMIESKFEKRVTLQYQIVRLDGLVVTKLCRDLILEKSTKLYQFQIDSLPLAFGIYMLSIELIEGNEVIATSNKIIEINTLLPPAGGRPALLPKVEISVSKKLNKGEKPCSVLTETI